MRRMHVLRLVVGLVMLVVLVAALCLALSRSGAPARFPEHRAGDFRSQ